MAEGLPGLGPPGGGGLPGLGGPAPPPAKAVMVGGAQVTEEQIASGQVEISEGKFIVGVKNPDNDLKNVELLIEAAKEQLDWAPEMKFGTMPMFAGTLDQDQILWFLRRGEVEYIEADGVVHIARKEKGATAEPAAAGLGGPAPPPAKAVMVGGEQVTEEQIASGQVEISEGKFIVGVKNPGNDLKNVELLIEAAKEQLDWAPEMKFGTMPMFAGTLDQDQILWFLRRGEVEYIEADGVVHIARKEKGATAEPA